MADMPPEQLKNGATYRGKRARRNIFGQYDDRTIIWGPTAFGELQYDSISVANGRHYPRTTVAKFLRWAKHEVKA